jgi:metal-responsive CopG/Arc/MetJ family transcriptional regulator
MEQVMKFQTITTRVESDQLRRFDALSRARGQTRAEVVRIALDSYLHMSTAAPANLNRIAQTTEFMQIALDLLVSRDMPDKRDAIITTVAQRMEELHGGR